MKLEKYLGGVVWLKTLIKTRFYSIIVKQPFKKRGNAALFSMFSVITFGCLILL